MRTMNSPINKTICDPSRRHDFAYLFDVRDGNPNGDPDAGNMPRVDPETMHGLVTDVAIKRKIRDYVALRHSKEKGCGIYIELSAALNKKHEHAYKACNIRPTGKKQKQSDIDVVRKWMCGTYYDIRMFGAVMTTGINCGQVRGPVQLTFARSVDPITPIDVTITRMAVTRVEDAEVASPENGKAGGGKRGAMGRKAIVPYGLYLGYGFFSPRFAKHCGVTVTDLEIFWDALINMFEVERSAARGMMALRGLWVFSHENELGNAHAHELFSMIRITRKRSVKAPRTFDDYEITVKRDLPRGVLLSRVVDG